MSQRKKWYKNSKEKGVQTRLQWYFNKSDYTVAPKAHHEDACPVCQQTLSQLSMNEFELHVNKCLDEMSHEALETWDESLIKEEASDEALINKNEASEWKIILDHPIKINGLWSSEEDHAPGKDETEDGWFKEYTMVNGKKQRRLPYYKRVAGTPFVVDAFSYGDIPDCEGYFLSHFHSDHYMGLNSHWIHGTIYCSEITARLVRSQLGVHPDFIQPIPLHIPTVITTHPLIKVTLIEANHCPGSVVFLFEMPEMGVRYLHTGDFRASPDLSEHPLIRQPDNPPIDILYLDTTYLDPKYSFPSQESCINAACEIALHHAELYNRVTSDKKLDGWLIKDTKEEVSTKTLFIVGVYTLGKEAVFINMAKSLNTKVFVTDEKRSILDCFKDKNLDDLFTDEPREAQVHAIPLNHLQPRNLEAYLSSLQPFFTEIIAIKPTGWTYRDSSDPYHPPPRSLESIQNEHKTSDDLIEVIMRKPIYDSIKIKIYGVPYSEHSSFRELALFISSLHIRRIVPTVHTSSKTSRINMSVFFDRWEQEKRERCQ